MATIGITIDYSNICKDYNTSFLDRDNTDPATKKCMKSVLVWMEKFLEDLLEKFQYKIYHLSSDTPLNNSDLAAKRFLFFSLEKEITLQSFTIAPTFIEYQNNVTWVENHKEGLLIKNDDEGEGIHIYLEQDSKPHLWLLEYLKEFTLDEAPLLEN
ncbi:MAG TPA: hypothetical protein ENK66_08245 [Arcobacter sp.]|jgi:hypothetical protein|nr:hypothetical protein [Arcobacter sp.]